MRFLIRSIIIVTLLVAIGAAAYHPVRGYLKKRRQPKFTFAEVTRGAMQSVVNATGKIKPVLSVSIGSFVSGPIVELNVDFNARVKKDDLLARIDTRIYEAAVARDQALLDTQNAEVQRADALLQQAVRDEKRALAIHQEDADFVSQAELDKLRFTKNVQEAQVAVARAAVKQAQANLDNSRANLGYTEIRAPTDGIVIDRKIDPGQTLAATFQTPELFVIAPNLDVEVYVFASIDETDIGLIRMAQEQQRPVEFRVDAYPNDLFSGRIKQIRMSSTETQGVVTYPVVVSSPNPELKLLPGMTAKLTFVIEEKPDVVRLPRAALWYYPKPELVHPDDRKILEGATESNQREKPQTTAASESASEQIAANKKRKRRHVWALQGDFLRAIEVTIGIFENQYAELTSGSLSVGQKLVTGIETK
jgi:HlyD family secretion protein